jgi:hypothetical protein
LIFGDAVAQLSAAPSKVPCTRTTGAGCAALGLQVKSLAPGGETAGSRSETSSADAAAGAIAVAQQASAAASPILTCLPRCRIALLRRGVKALGCPARDRRNRGAGGATVLAWACSST